MRFVDKPVHPIQQCVVTAAPESRRGWIDTQNEFPAMDPRIYVSVEGAEKLGKFIGMACKEDHQAVLDEVAALKAELEQAQGELERYARLEENVDYTLRHFGTQIRQKPGPKATA